MSLRRSASPPSRAKGLSLVFNRSRSSIDSWNDRSPVKSPKPLLPFCTSPSHLEDITLDMDPSDTISPYSDTLQSPAIQASTSMCGRTVKEYEEQLRVLKKENFNLKLRIYFLEERMTRRPGPAGDAEEDAERKLIELKVELESLRREMKSKQLLLAQAGKAIELMEEQHSSELQKLRRDMSALEARFRHPQRHVEPLDNSMQLYVDAFNVRHSLLVPSTVKPESEPAKQEREEADDSEVAELHRQLQQCLEELEACRERERQLADTLESKEPQIQIKVQELCHKDAQLEEQRRIIVEIQIRLDEKQKQLEALRQSLEVSQATATRLEAEHTSLREQLQESEKKRNKASGVVQGLMAKTKLLTDELREVKERHSKAEWESRQQPPDEIGEMVNEETERLWAELEEQRHQVERLGRENSALLREKAQVEQGLRQELSDARLALDRALRPASGMGSELGATAKMMLGRLDELAAFLAAMLRRPAILSGLSQAHRASLLQVLETSWDSTRRRYSLSLTWQPDSSTAQPSCAGDESLIQQIQAFLQGPDKEELLSEVEAQRERSAELWPVSMTGELGAGREMQLIAWESSKAHDEEDEEEGGGATAVEREPPGSHNQSESEAWSEPDRSVSLARMGLPESLTPVVPDRSSLVSPASSEADLVTRTPGKRASARRLANRLRDSEQINEALRAELGAYQVLYRNSPASPPSPVTEAGDGFPALSMLQEMQSQRSRLESLLKQNDVIRQQLENTRLSSVKGDDCVRLREVQLSLEQSQARVKQLEEDLEVASARCRALEFQLKEREALHTRQAEASARAQEALASLQASEVSLKKQVSEARTQRECLEEQARLATQHAQELEAAAVKDSERCELLTQQVSEAQAECQRLQEEIIHQQELAIKPAAVDISIQTSDKSALILDHGSFANSTGPSSLIHLSDCDDVFHADPSITDQSVAVPHDETQRHALSSPDLGIESDTGRMSSLEAATESENLRLKQRLAESQRLMESCLAALCRKNKVRQQEQASMEQQLRRTEEVLAKAKANLVSLGSPFTKQITGAAST